MEIKDRILVVEDDKRISSFFKTVLESNRYDVIMASTGSEAYSLITSQCPDLVILDLGLPDMDGVEVIRRIRSWSNMPIIVISARSEDTDKIDALDAGADDYLTKPFHSKELLARIRAITRAQTVHVNSKLTMGNVTLDRATFELSTSKGSFRLANKEFQMLELLMCNPHQLISSERFLEKIWGYDSEAEINVVWVYISYLRKKLAALQADIQIKVTRSVGYSLEEIK